MNFFDSCSIKGKLIVLVSACFAPLALLALLFVQAETRLAALASQERAGAQYLHAMQPLRTAISAHRETARTLLISDAQASAPLTARLATLQTSIDQAFAEFESVPRRLGEPLPVAQQISAIKARWQTLLAEQGAWSVANTLPRYDALIKALHDLGTHIVKSAHLSVDPHFDTRALVSVVADHLPLALHNLGALSAAATTIAHHPYASLRQRKELTRLHARAALAIDAALTEVRAAIDHRAEMKVELRPPATRLQQSSTYFLTLVERQILDAFEPEASPQELHASGNAVSEAALQLFSASAMALDARLAERIAASDAHVFRLLTALALSLVLALILGVLAARSLARDAQHATGAVTEMREPDEQQDGAHDNARDDAHDNTPRYAHERARDDAQGHTHSHTHSHAHSEAIATGTDDAGHASASGDQIQRAVEAATAASAASVVSDSGDRPEPTDEKAPAPWRGTERRDGQRPWTKAKSPASRGRNADR